MSTVRLTGRNDTYTTKSGDAAVYALGGNDKITIEGYFYDKENDRTEIVVYGGGGNDTVVSRGGISGQEAYGGPGNDRIEIKGGDDVGGVAVGAGGDDTLICGGGDEPCFLDGGAGNDTLSNQSEHTPTIMKGRAGEDILLAGTGRSTMEGGPGRDTMTAGTQSDRIAFERGDTVAGAKRDTVNGFAQGQDLIDLSIIDANGQQPGNQAFTFIASTKHPAIGQVSYYKSGTSTIVVANDGVKAFEIELQNFDQPVLATDFTL